MSKRGVLRTCWHAVTADFRPLGLSRWFWFKRWLHYLVNGDDDAAA